MKPFEAQKIEFKRSNQFSFGPISIDLNPGECLGILGENGSGKSTLLSLISGDLKLDSGKIIHSSVDIDTLTVKDRARIIAVVPQRIEFGLDFTVEETVLLGRTPYSDSIWESPEDHRIADNAIDQLKLQNLKDRKITEISGGELQRTLIARALAQQPKILLLDEPTAHLDVRHHHELATTLQNLKQEGITLLITSHDMNWLNLIADKTLILQGGQQLAYGTTSETMNAEHLQKAFGVPFQSIKGSDGHIKFYSEPDSDGTF